MDDRRKSDEQAYLTTPDVVVKSVPFEATLTDRRIILVDTKDDLIPPKEIALETVRRAEPGENAIRDPILTLWIVAGGETRQMILTFPQRKGATRKHERDEWASLLRDLIAPPVRRAPARPAPAAEPRKRIIEYSAAKEEEAIPQETLRFRDEPRPAPAPAPRDAEDSGPQPYGTFCSKCGNRLAPGSQFCNRCGAKSVVPAGSAASPSPPRTGQGIAERAPASGRGPEEPARQPAPYHEPPYESGRIGPHHREKSGFLSGLFSRKKKPAAQHAAPAHPAPAPRAPARKSPTGPSKKTLMTIGIAAVILVVVAAVGWFAMGFLSGLSLGGTGDSSGSGSSSGSSATPTAGSTLAYNAVSTVTIAKTKAPITIPAEGVALYVNYLGGWKGTYTVNGETISLERSGEYVRELEGASGTVEASMRKKDGSSHELVVKIYKNGAELANGATSQANGEVTVSADVGVAAVTATPTVTATKTTSN